MYICTIISIQNSINYEKGSHTLCSVCTCKDFILRCGYPLQAQVSNPSSWESFVGSDENRLVSDTHQIADIRGFRMG